MSKRYVLTHPRLHQPPLGERSPPALACRGTGRERVDWLRLCVYIPVQCIAEKCTRETVYMTRTDRAIIQISRELRVRLAPRLEMLNRRCAQRWFQHTASNFDTHAPQL